MVKKLIPRFEAPIVYQIFY